MILKNKIKKIIDAIESTDIKEIEISSFWGFQKIKLKKGVHFAESNLKQATSQENVHVEEDIEENINKPDKKEKDPEVDISNDYDIIKAPLVGTFYQSKKPGDPPFVEIDSKINIGDTICIIEAMKIFNDIDSEDNAIIKEVLVQDGEPVEFDQPLFKIQKL